MNYMQAAVEQKYNYSHAEVTTAVHCIGKRIFTRINSFTYNMSLSLS